MKFFKLIALSALSASTANGQTVTGFGSNNVLTKWTGSGFTSNVTNSLLRDNGTTISLGNYIFTPPCDYMMHIYEGPSLTPPVPHKIGLSVELFSRSATGPVKGLNCNVQDNQENIGIDVYTANGTNTYGGNFVANNASQNNKAVVGAAIGGTNAYGAIFTANNGAHNYGAYFTATDGENQNTAISADAFDYSGTTTGQNYGLNVFAITDNRDENFGIKTLAADASAGNTASFGIWAEISSSNSGSYAGYFTAPANTTNCAYFDGTITTTSPVVVVSDQKFKTDVQPLKDALAKIMALKPSTYLYKTQGEFPSFNFPSGRQYGLIAQEAEQVIPEIVKSATNPARYDKEGKKITDAVDFKGVAYGELIPILAAAIQEQQKIIEIQNEKIALLEKRTTTSGTTASVSPAGNSASETMLFQNVPNPFNGSTVIGYRITQTYSSAVIMICDMNGKKIKSLPVQDQEGEITVSAVDLSSGMYLYSLILDGQERATKRMVLNQ